MSGQQEIATESVSSSKPTAMDKNVTSDGSCAKQSSSTDALGEMINSAAMSILDGEDFTMGPAPVK